jgi:biopolymer transport protein ExbD
MVTNAGSGQVQAAINVTPMIDLLLVLLIIFMAIAPARSSGLDAAVPQNSAEAPQSPRDNPVVLEIATNGSYSLNSQVVAQSLLRERLIAVFARRGQRVLFVRAAATLDFGIVAEAIDLAHGVNIDHVALMPR